jgi:hypothetical protein
LRADKFRPCNPTQCEPRSPKFPHIGQCSELGLQRNARGGNNAPVGYDGELAERIRELAKAESGVTEMRAFGGLAFLIDGKMAVSASGQGGLLLRVPPAETEALLGEPYAQPFEMRGRQMKGWLRVEVEGLRTKRQLARWVTLGVTYARSLPSKG